jgi:glycosyltransferase involved in cell wall biosynthesis
MRVLMVHDEPIEGGYGAEAYVRRLIGGLREAGDEVDVLAGEVKHNGTGRVRDVWDTRARNLVSDRAVEFGADIIHFHNIARELSPSVLGSAPQVPAVMTVHDFRLLGAFEHSLLGARGYVERGVARQVRRAAIRRLAATIGVSDHLTKALRDVGFPNVTTVRVPVDAPSTLPRPVADCDDVAVVARLSKDKGVDDAIAAFAAATDKARGDRRILVAGDGPLRDRLQRKYSGDWVQFLGRLDEAAVSDLLGRVRAVIVGSQPWHRPEGSSLTMVEAAMHGRPVVASEDPAVKEAAALLGNALVTGSGIEAFTESLDRLLTDPALATDLGQRGKVNAVQLHSIAAVTSATREVYEAAVSRTAA